MIASLVGRPGRRLLLAAGCCVALCMAAGCAVGGRPAQPPSRPAPHRGRAVAAPAGAATSRARPSGGATAPLGAVPAVGGGPVRLARLLATAEAVLAAAGASPAAVARQALIVQLTCLRLAAHPGWAGAVIGRVTPAQRAAAAADIAATADLVALTPPVGRLPPWRIVPAKTMAALRADYRAAQAATGVGWSYLAAINFVETDFGRIIGPSTAGAEGPMQFMPATWAIYGHGDIYRARNAIFAAARFLASHGAPGDTGSALYAYNPSPRYVDAVLRYARRLRADPNALSGFYHREVIFRLARGWVLLPPGYGSDPAVRPIPVRI